LLAAESSRAGDLTITAENSTASPGSSGSFDVVVQNETAAPVTIAGFSVDVLLASTASVSFTGINNNTTTTYIFSNIPPSNTPSFGFESVFVPGEATGNDFAASGGQVLNVGQSFGLAHVSYLAASGASGGSVGVTLEPLPVLNLPFGGTNLSDANGVTLDSTSVNGTITILGSTTVPEPSTVIMLAAAGTILLLSSRRPHPGGNRQRHSPASSTDMARSVDVTPVG